MAERASVLDIDRAPASREPPPRSAVTRWMPGFRIGLEAEQLRDLAEEHRERGVELRFAE
jgi:hypothetical protein